MNRLVISLGEETLKMLILDYLREKLGNVDLSIDDLNIQVKSKQNYKSEWEKNVRLIKDGYRS